MDGYITIGTELSTDKFDKQINDLEKKIQKEEDKKIIIEAKLDTQKQELELAIKKTDELADAYERLQIVQEKINQGGATPQDFTQFQNLQNQYGSLENLGNLFDKALTKQDAIEQKVNSTKLQYDGIVNKVTEYKQKVEGINLQKQQADIEKIKTGFSGVGSNIEKAVKNVSRLALGIFSIRSAYLAIRRYSSDLAGYDPQYAANLEYIRWVLTQAIAPALKGIVTLIGTILQYIYAILNAWFGIGAKLDLSAESFRKMKNSAGGVSKAVKQIKKDLLGFDEINRLTDQSDTGTSAGAGGVGIPDFDVGGLGNIPKWLQWIMDNKQTILAILGTIAGIFAGIKIASFLQSLHGVFTAFRNISALKMAGVFAGIAIAIVGLVQTIQGLIGFIKDPSWENFIPVLNGIETALIGVGIAMVALNASNPVGWILLAVAAIIEYVKWITTDTNKIKTLEEAEKSLTEAIEATTRARQKNISAIENAEEAQKALIEAERINKISGEELYNQVENGILTYQKMNEAQREVYKAYVNNMEAQQNLEATTEELIQKKHEEKLANLDNSLSLAEQSKNYDELKQTVLDAYDKQEIKVEEARDILENAMHDMSYETILTFTKDIPSAIAEGLDPFRYSSPIHKFQVALTSAFDTIKKALKSLFNINASVNVTGTSAGGRAKGGIYYPSMMPKLAVGGIINMPGRGAPYNGAVIGERGAEAVVPLTDTQQMELLGATIGKYITVNANIVNTMNGRVISRELKQVQSEQDFAYNM